MRRVHIELQRVQTWLFSAPRLRAMVGANTLLGETLRVSLPKVARAGGARALSPAMEPYPAADSQDPLKDHDDPAADAQDGILARDGGHFEALFANGADAFASKAAALLRRELPGLRFRISIDRDEWKKSAVHLSTELPVLAPCEWTGRGLASEDVQQGDEHASVSMEVQRRHEAAKRAERGQASDLASLLVATTNLKDFRRVVELKELVGSGYIALIHADGNGVGSGAGKTEVERAAFFHGTRVLLRRAVQKAIDVFCAVALSSGNSRQREQAPLIPLMLGGDDLLVVCRADTALPFVVALCKALAETPRGEARFELTLGVGVVLAKHTIPIHRLHEVSEQLAGSAKRRFRGFPKDAPRSVVDWAVYSTAWIDDPEEVRRRDWVRGTGRDLRVLSQRPVDVLGSGLDSLQGLLRGAEKIVAAPRSQFHYLIEQLSRGRALSELAFAELSREARTALKNVGLEQVWRRSGDDGPWLTEVLDLVEVSEIGRLGSSHAALDAPEPVEEAIDG